MIHGQNCLHALETWIRTDQIQNIKVVSVLEPHISTMVEQQFHYLKVTTINGLANKEQNTQLELKSRNQLIHFQEFTKKPGMQTQSEDLSHSKYFK